MLFRKRLFIYYKKSNLKIDVPSDDTELRAVKQNLKMLLAHSTMCQMLEKIRHTKQVVVFFFSRVSGRGII